MKKLFLLFLTTLLLSSCTSAYKSEYKNSNSEKLEKNKKIAIAVSEDGAYGSDVYSGSGKILSKRIKQKLENYSSDVNIFKNNETLNDFSEDEINAYDYIVIPEIIHWEDRITAWSGLPDKVEISIEIFDSQRKLLNSANLSGRSAVMTLGPTDPIDILEKPLTEYFASIFED